MVEVWDNYKFDSDYNQVFINGLYVRTTAKQYALALLFFRNLSKPLSREHIVKTVWGPEAKLTGRTLDVHVSQIRNRLKLTPQGGFIFSPVYTYGYRLDRLSEWDGVPPRGGD